MLIVCTKDPNIVRTAQNPRSGSGRWGQLVILNPTFNQAQATAAMTGALRGLGRNEPLCFSAHGNDDEIGDAGSGVNDWAWTRADIAGLLQSSAPARYTGPILISACAENVSNFSAGLAVQLERIRALDGVWCYGYNRPLSSTAGYPDPTTLDRQADLQGTQVNYGMGQVTAEGAATAAHPACHGYRVTSPSGHTLQLPQGFDLEEARKLLTLLAEAPRR